MMVVAVFVVVLLMRRRVQAHPQPRQDDADALVIITTKPVTKSEKDELNGGRSNGDKIDPPCVGYLFQHDK
jgi:hypothetical protein